jgi:hypothetical protein
MAVTYSKKSAYYGTGLYGNFLDVLDFRTIGKQVDDVYYTIDKVYQNRPDLLAYDLYGDSSLWWVFAARNPDVIRDPIFDFVSGITIYIPKQTTLEQDLGL